MCVRWHVGDEHGSQQRGAAGEDEAVDGDDDGRALQVLELGMLDFAVDLGQALFAAHGQDGVAEGHEDAEQAEDRQARILSGSPSASSLNWRWDGMGDGGRCAPRTKTE